jgi:hypothetical protein
MRSLAPGCDASRKPKSEQTPVAGLTILWQEAPPGREAILDCFLVDPGGKVRTKRPT